MPVTPFHASSCSGPEPASSRRRVRELRRLLSRGSARRRGAALIVSLFSLLMVTGMGLLAVRSAVDELQGANNFRINKQAERLSDSALQAALGEFSAFGDSYWALMKQNALASTTVLATATKEYSLDNTKLGSMVNTDATGDLASLPPMMGVRVHDPLDGFSAAGYSADFCFKRFRFDATASFGTPPPDADAILDQENRHYRYSRFAHRAFGLLGPIECDGN